MGCGSSGPAPPAVGSAVIVEHEGAVEPGHATSAGVVRFVGAVPSLKSGIWVGVELDEPAGNCSGRVGSKRIFKCRPHHGVLIRPACVLLEHDFWGGGSSGGGGGDGGGSGESGANEARAGTAAAPRDSFFGRLRTAVLGTSVSDGEPSGRLAADCEPVVDMAEAEKERGSQRFLSLQTRALERKFPPGNFDLQGLDRIFSQIKKMLREYDVRQFDEVFPSEWRMQLLLAQSCCAFARQAIVRLLEERMDQTTRPVDDTNGGCAPVGGSSKPACQDTVLLDVSVLVRAVSQTAAFEKYLDSRFKSEVAVPSEPKSDAHGRKKKNRKKRDQPAHIESADAAPPQFVGFFTDAFEPYLVLVVQHQVEHLQQVIQELVAEETAQSAQNGERAEPGFKFKSAINMFLIMRDNLEQCAAISRGQALMLLQGSLKSILHNYADAVAAKLPSKVRLPAGPPHYQVLFPVDTQDKGRSCAVLSSSFGSHDVVQVPRTGLSHTEVVTTCATLNTAGYCDRTVAQLRALVVRLLNAAFSEHVDMLAEQEYFHDVLIPSAMSLLLDHTMASSKQSFRMLKSRNWTLVKDVGDPSKFVTNLHDSVKYTVQQIRDILDDVMFSAFCDRLVGLILPAFLQTIFQCQRIGHTGSLQLLLDSSIVQKLVLTLPNLPVSSPGGRSTAAKQLAPQTAYAQLVASQMSHVHAALQMVGMDIAYIEKSFLTLWPDGSAEDLMDILKLKGLLQEDRREYATRLGLPYRNDPSSAWDAPLTPGVAPLKLLSAGLNQAWRSTRKTLTILDSPLVTRSASDTSPPRLQRSVSGPARGRQTPTARD